MENKAAEAVKAFYFIAVAVLMYYFLTEVIDFRLFITYRHVFALVIAASGIVSFLYKPDIARGAAAAESVFVYCIPMLVTVVASLFIWFVGQVDVAVISRGLSGTFVYSNMLSFTLAAAAFLYMFGEKGIWYNLTAILIANMLMILTIMVQYGMGNYFSELAALIRTFADETGEIIVRAEVHELAFCIGAYLIYMILKPKKGIPYLILFILAMFCFLSAFKRIAMLAIVISLFFGGILKLISLYKQKAAQKAAEFFCIITILLLIGYIALINMDAFEILEGMGIDTSGRVGIYNAVDKYYTFSPGFLGNGIGFLTYQLNTNTHLGVAAVHNDFLQYFIDLGFWGYIIWLISMTYIRVRYFGKNGKTENSIVAFSLIVYLIVVSMTDNTMNYPLVTLVIAILMMGHGFDEKVRDTEMKIFGYVSERNRTVSD